MFVIFFFSSTNGTRRKVANQYGHVLNLFYLNFDDFPGLKKCVADTTSGKCNFKVMHQDKTFFIQIFGFGRLPSWQRNEGETGDLFQYFGKSFLDSNCYKKRKLIENKMFKNQLCTKKSLIKEQITKQSSCFNKIDVKLSVYKLFDDLNPVRIKEETTSPIICRSLFFFVFLFIFC